MLFQHQITKNSNNKITMGIIKHISPRSKLGYPSHETTNKHFNIILHLKNIIHSPKTSRKHLLLLENSVITTPNSFVKIMIFKYPPLEVITYHNRRG